METKEFIFSLNNCISEIEESFAKPIKTFQKLIETKLSNSVFQIESTTKIDPSCTIESSVPNTTHVRGKWRNEGMEQNELIFRFNFYWKHGNMQLTKISIEMRRAKNSSFHTVDISAFDNENFVSTLKDFLSENKVIEDDFWNEWK